MCLPRYPNFLVTLNDSVSLSPDKKGGLLMPLWVFLLLCMGAVLLLGMIAELTRQHRRTPPHTPKSKQGHSLDDGYDLRDWNGFH